MLSKADFVWVQFSVIRCTFCRYLLTAGIRDSFANLIFYVSAGNTGLVVL